MTEKPFATGRCLCGAVTFSLRGQPIGTGQCHCKDCQRASGTGHMSLAFFKREDVEIKGDTRSFAVKADSGNINTRHFCPTCGGRVYGENSARPGFVGIAVGAVEDNDWFKPQRVVYVGRKPAWDVTANDIPNFEMMPPPPPKQ
jgi:hypothetical protein